MAQSTLTIGALTLACGLLPEAISIHPVQTVGDKIQDRPLAEIGGKALWTKELDRALLDGSIDFAVHSMKDVETWLPPGIVVAAVLLRADPRDRLIGAASIAEIAEGATVGTSSPRRMAQLLYRRPDLRVVTLRGNVATRLRRIEEGAVAATFLAAAGLQRLQVEAGHTLSLDQWLPAASQGVVGITCRADDHDILKLLETINHEETMRAMLAERAVLDGLGGSCHTSVAVHARGTDASQDELGLMAELYSPDGRQMISAEGRGTDPRALGLQLAEQLKAQATPEIIASLSYRRPA